MAIPNINLIPPAYYLRKKNKVAIALAVLGNVAVIGGLLAATVMQTQRQKELEDQRTHWQGRVDAIAATRSQAQTAASSVGTLSGYTKFIQDTFTANAYWATVLGNIRDYTYPRVTYTAIKPAAGSDIVAMHIRVPDTARIPAQEALNLYWAGIRRSPMIASVIPNTMLGWPPAQTGGGGGGGVGIPTPGGPPAGGAPLPGGPPAGGAPQPAYIYSPGQMASRATGALGAQNDALMLAQNPGGLPTLNPGTFPDPSALIPPPPPEYEFDITARLKKPIQLPQLPGGAPAEPTQ